MRCIKQFLLVALLLLPSLGWADGALTPLANPPLSQYTIVTSGIPFIKASSGTMGNNGAVSAMTALPRTFSSGAYLYLPADAIVAGSTAGWYWFVASSTTAGTVYNSTYTSGVPQPGTTTAFATTGPGAFTGTTGAITAVSVTIPANMMGRTGRTNAEFAYSFNNTAGAKTNAVVFGGSNCFTVNSTTQGSLTGRCSVTNRGLTNRQVNEGSYMAASGGVFGNVSSSEYTVTTTSDVTVAFNFNVAVATDHSILETYLVRVTPGN